MSERPRILVVDDDHPTLKLIDKVLDTAGFRVVLADSGPSALKALEGQAFDAAVLDLRMPDMDGLTLMREVKRIDQQLPVVITTGHPEVQTAIDALKGGAVDYLPKPFDLDRLRDTVARSVTLRERRVPRPARPTVARELLGVSPAMQRVRDLVARVARTDAAVLIEGESGTGKEVVAALVHRLSRRSAAPFVVVGCGGIPAPLMESQLFGHVRGAFTGAVADAPGLFRSADGGTIFLDEVGELPPEIQAGVLRSLSERQVRPLGATRPEWIDVRIVAATDKNLDAAVKTGKFRRDLLFRLNVVRVVLPPLRERKEDIPVLAAHFVRELNERLDRKVIGLTPDALATLSAHDFPGNVGELHSVLERAYALGASGEITPDDLPLLSMKAQELRYERMPTVAEAERDLIVRALELHGGDRERASQTIGISSRTLYRRLKDYDIV